MVAWIRPERRHFTITFPPNPFSGVAPANQPATFTGLFNDPTPKTPLTPDLGSSGAFSLVMTNDGNFVGSLICAGVTHPFTNQFSISKTAAICNWRLYGEPRT